MRSMMDSMLMRWTLPRASVHFTVTSMRVASSGLLSLSMSWSTFQYLLKSPMKSRPETARSVPVVLDVSAEPSANGNSASYFTRE
jgi:hypothetical protein